MKTDLDPKTESTEAKTPAGAELGGRNCSESLCEACGEREATTYDGAGETRLCDQCKKY